MAKAYIEKLATLPDSPGVYLMKDRQGKIFYIGKAKRLKDRIRSYFSGTDTRAFVFMLDSLLDDIEVILTDSEKEALILENELIKKHQPRFNVKLIDDKRFLCLRIDLKQKYPRLEVQRGLGKDGARYFGPYHSAVSIRETLRIINRYFQLRTCSDQVLNNRSKPCLQYQIKRCPAPCVFDLSQGEYAGNVANVVRFLEGRRSELLNALNNRMQQASDALEFETAAALRDQIQAVERSLERQRMVSSDFANRDVVGLFREGTSVDVHVMRTRGGKMIDAKRFSFSDVEVPTEEILADFAMRYYFDGEDLPDEILFPSEMDWHESLASLLSEHSQRRIRVVVPQRGEKHQMIELASRNAHQAYLDSQRQKGAAQTALEKLQRSLHLRVLPARLECFDISHIQGSYIVASMVRFDNGVPNKKLYRHYKIRSTTTQDDFKSMYEVICRRLRRGLEEGNLPDLLVIDGGKGQLGAAKAAMDDHGVDSIDVIGLAKSRVLDEATTSPERIFVLGQKDPIVLRQNAAELFILTRARDEAHRFAITFHRQQRSQGTITSQLDKIVGIGPKKRQLLLKHFGSVAAIKSAAIEDIAKIVGQKLAESIVASFQ